MNKVFLGILGDPAKITHYDNEFYDILEWDETHSIFYLLGASERGVKKSDIKSMYSSIKKNVPEISPIPNLTKKSKGVSSRIGLFPSSPRQLIKGPGFTFAPYPINTTKIRYLIQSRFLKQILTPFISLELLTLGYHPMGGKAAKRVAADVEPDIMKIKDRFKKSMNSRYIDWVYLEGGSGMNFLGADFVSNVFSDISIAQTTPIIPQTIYGGGIREEKQLMSLLNEKNIPQCIIIGNISEEDIKMTYKLIDVIQKYNLRH